MDNLYTDAKCLEGMSSGLKDQDVEQNARSSGRYKPPKVQR